MGAPGTLYVVATPLGNLSDFSPRALATLQKVSFIVCEDTRRTHTLLAHFRFTKECVSYHEHSPRSRETELVARLSQGESAALVTDAGTPLLADPGSRLVQAAVAVRCPVVPIPGPSAVTTLLSVSGFSADQFYFSGFVPAKVGEARRFFERLKGFACPVVFFETPHRFEKTVGMLGEMFPERRFCVGRELTKLHEEIVYGVPSVLPAQFAGRRVLGEFTLVMEGLPITAQRKFQEGCQDDRQDEPLLEFSQRGELAAFTQFLKERNLSRKDIAHALALLFPEKKKEYYQLVTSERS